MMHSSLFLIEPMCHHVAQPRSQHVMAKARHVVAKSTLVYSSNLELYHRCVNNVARMYK
jgi:hypothetical protein